jgi:Zn-dependent protease with chaperone function
MKRIVCRTLLLLPERIIRSVTETTWFVSSFEDGWAFTLRGDELKKGEHLIFLTDELLDEPEQQIIWTVLHEVGHVVLGHRNSIGRVQSKAEVRHQEKEADEFAKKYLETVY